MLQACASTDKPKPGMKIGMHIDAVLEFVVEYPLSWSKERRLTYGSKNGELRWRHPDQQGTHLRIKSSVQEQEAVSIEQALQEYGGLEVTLEEKVTLRAGEALHITGHTPQGNLDIYLLSHESRSYLIALTTPLKSIDHHVDIMNRVIYSFQVMQ